MCDSTASDGLSYVFKIYFLTRITCITGIRMHRCVCGVSTPKVSFKIIFVTQEIVPVDRTMGTPS